MKRARGMFIKFQGTQFNEESDEDTTLPHGLLRNLGQVLPYDEFILKTVNDDSYLIRLLPQLNEFIRRIDVIISKKPTVNIYYPLLPWLHVIGCCEHFRTTGQVTRPIRVNNWHLRTEGKLVRIGVITIFILILTIQGYQLFLYSAESLPATTRQSSMMTSSASSPYDPANLDGQSANTSNERDPILDNNSIMGNNSGSGIAMNATRLCDASPELLKLIKDSKKKYEKSLSNKSTSSNVSFLLKHKVEELLAELSEYIGAFQPTDLMVESNQIVTEVSRQTR
ncbi:hypothetical protein RhiirB3_425899 [Rhizophagus irregularis]|nr:hypothetical protein RhiirB3_425899 [Rhizophagus irregularis]